MHGGAAVHVKQTRQADSKRMENLNLKPHQLSIRFPVPTFEKVNSSQVEAVVLLPAPASFRGKGVYRQGNFQTEQSGGEGKERKENSPPGVRSSCPVARWQANPSSLPPSQPTNHLPQHCQCSWPGNMESRSVFWSCFHQTIIQ